VDWHTATYQVTQHRKRLSQAVGTAAERLAAMLRPAVNKGLNSFGIWLESVLRKYPSLWVNRGLSPRTQCLLLAGIPLVYTALLAGASLFYGQREHALERAALQQADSIREQSQAILSRLLDIDNSLNVFIATSGTVKRQSDYKGFEELSRQNLRLLASEANQSPEEDIWVTKTRSDAELLLGVLWSLDLKMTGASNDSAVARAIMAKQYVSKLQADLAGFGKLEQVRRAASTGDSEIPRLIFIFGLHLLFDILFWIVVRKFWEDGTFAKFNDSATLARIEKLRLDSAHIEAAYGNLRAEVMGTSVAVHKSSRSRADSGVTSMASSATDLDIIRTQLKATPDHVFKSVLDGLIDGVVVVDAAGATLYVNRSAQTIIGPNAEGISLKKWIAQHSSNGSGRTQNPKDALVDRSAETSFSRHTEVSVPCGRNQFRKLWVSTRTIKDQLNRTIGIFYILADVTESGSSQQALHQAKEDAERANRAKSEFLSRMSHELRTPLNAILGFAQLLQRAQLVDPHSDSVEQILKAGRHLLVLINEVLDVARIESGRLSLALERLSPLDVVQETVTLIEPQAAKQKIQLYTEAGAAWRMHITADRQRFKQVLLNLISNAIKYNNPGGSVRISADAHAGWLRLNVADTGPGISKDKLSRLFSPFERLGAETSGVEGTGIGLALSKRLVEAMSGRIGVQTEPGQGSTFWVEYPLSAENLAPALVQTSTDLQQLSRNIAQPLVLCVEDNDSNFQLIQRTLAARFVTLRTGLSLTFAIA